MKLYKFKIFTLSVSLIICSCQLVSGKAELTDSTKVQQKDIKDVFQDLFNKQFSRDTSTLKGNGPFISIIPAVGYSMHTGITGVIATNTTFYTDNERKKLSRIMINGYYSQFHQYWFTGISNIFLEKQKLHFFGDTRYYKFPTQTYGLGSNSSPSDPLQIDYSYFRFYQVLFREIASNLYIGMGYNLDYHWNIKIDSVKGSELDQFVKYQNGPNSVSSGVSLNFLYDDRKNAVNPQNGTFANVQLRPNLAFLGSDINWQSLLIEIRHYIKVPAFSNNILALWSYNDITISGAPPYLDMPSIGWDDYSSTGRGYAPGRYTGINLIYFESEYRFSLTRNGLLGGVIFGNVESISESSGERTHSIVPGGGLGLRIKIKKASNTNLAIDYGFGIKGSRGFFFNMGEVF
jgi:hypothetical protein